MGSVLNQETWEANNGGTLELTGSWSNSGGTLAVGAGSTLALNATTGSLTLADNGTIKGGTITLSGGAQVIPGGGSFWGTLDGVTLNGNLDLSVRVSSYQVGLRVLHGLVLNGTMYLGSADGNTIGPSSSGHPVPRVAALRRAV
jgi:hypothetical protein